MYECVEKTSHNQTERPQTVRGLPTLLLLTRLEQDALELESWHAPHATRRGDVGVPDKGSPERTSSLHPEGPSLVPEDHLRHTCSLKQAPVQIPAPWWALVSAASISVHIGEGTSHPLELQAEAESAQGPGSRRAAGDQDDAQSKADDEPLESSIRQQMLDVQRGVREDLAEIHESMGALISIMEESM
ncbi:uncharacterized protein LOC144685716 [Cetorhinus maximus]